MTVEEKANMREVNAARQSQRLEHMTNEDRAHLRENINENKRKKLQNLSSDQRKQLCLLNSKARKISRNENLPTISNNCGFN